MNATIRQEAPAPDEIEALLPWHAAGTLSRRESDRVEKALAADPELARRFELVREELSETISLNESLGAPSARAMQKLFAAIDAEPVPVRHRVAALGLGGRIAGWFESFSPRTLAYAGGVAMLAIVLQAGVITGLLVNEQGAPTAAPSLASYSDKAAPAAPAAVDGTYLLVRFAPTATATEITAALKASEASVVSGPDANNFYRVKLALTGVPKEELAKAVKKLQDSKSVGMALPN